MNGHGPPEDGGDRARKNPVTDVIGAHQTHRHGKPSAAGCQVSRCADAWRYGFGCGFRDALRLAARRLPPECWSVLDELASDYELAGSDG